MKPSENLARAKALIEDPKRWVQGTYCRVLNGVACYCAFGALSKTLCDEPTPPWSMQDRSQWPLEVQILQQSAKQLFGEDVVFINDRLGHAAVIALFNCVIEAAREREAR